ncbi:MAG: hypothetical protein AAF629_22550 [Chloroflexota bacterium]
MLTQPQAKTKALPSEGFFITPNQPARLPRSDYQSTIQCYWWHRQLIFAWHYRALPQPYSQQALARTNALASSALIISTGIPPISNGPEARLMARISSLEPDEPQPEDR